MEFHVVDGRSIAVKIPMFLSVAAIVLPVEAAAQESASRHYNDLIAIVRCGPNNLQTVSVPPVA